jgi:BirA family biotin operon repressor/biotin-[acetyl-CoA-carboxylase] ligase
VLRFESLPSTNLEAGRRAVEGAEEGLCVVAAEQTAGRGRLERQWISPKDAGLYFSIVLRPRLEQKNFPLLTLMAALAVRDALLDACGLLTDIKWPNDILADERKLCGILAEVVETKLGRAVILGIGINLAKESLPTELVATATSIEAVAGELPDLERVLAALRIALAKRYDLLQADGGAAATIEAWLAASSYGKGKMIRVTNGSNTLDGAYTLEGITDGLEPDGALRIKTPAGNVKIVRAGDVTVLRA